MQSHKTTKVDFSCFWQRKKGEENRFSSLILFCLFFKILGSGTQGSKDF